jgi:hypothetical protein
MTLVPRASRHLLLAFSLLAVGNACSRGSSLARSESRSAVELTVDNKGTLELTVYVVHDGRTERLDRVEAATKRTLTIPVRMVGQAGDFRLIGERPGARAGYPTRISSQIVAPTRCQRLEWMIEAVLDQSALGVFPSDRCSS